MAASACLKGFDVQRVQLPYLAINYASVGTGPQILLLLGHPQTHIVWRKVAPRVLSEELRLRRAGGVRSVWE